MTRAFALTALVVGLAMASCGSDDSGETTAPTTFSVPSVTSPIPSTTTATPTTTTPTGSTTTTGREGNGKVNTAEPDSETNDVPPPAGTPQEAFEKQCEQNPEACG